MSFLIGLLVLFIIARVMLSVTSFAIKALLGVVALVVFVAIIPAFFALMLPLVVLACGVAAVGLLLKAIF